MQIAVSSWSLHRMGYDFVSDMEHARCWKSLLSVKTAKDTATLSKGESRATNTAVRLARKTNESVSIA